MDRGRQTESDTHQVNPGYAHWQLAKALTTSVEHADPEARERAQQKVAKWVKVLEGLVDGSIAAGSRTPVSGVPAWATLEVVTGGFATGALLAGGPILDHEHKLLAELSPARNEVERQTLNRYFLTDEGISRLQALLESGCYEIDVPEEGALLVVAWLLDRGQPETARSLLEEIGPFLSKLRFYPRPVEQPRRFGSRVYVQDVAGTLNSLANIRPNPQILSQKEAIEVWTPLYDRTVSLFLETLDGEPPRFASFDAAAANKPTEVVGGRPCQVYPEGWANRAGQLLTEYAAKRRVHQLCGKPERKTENFFQLRHFLGRCVTAPDSLSQQDIERIRLLLARCVSRRGSPTSLECAALRQRQSEQTRKPMFHEVSKVVADRLAGFPRDSGIDDLEPIVRPISDEEANQHRIANAAEIPESIQRKVERCLTETADELIRRGVITSGDTLARVLPQVTSGLRAAGIVDPALRQLYAAVYRAFRRRRSLLLLNLESQVKINELPWVAAIEQFRQRDLAASDLARATLQEVTALAIISFPQAILPNKLLQELRDLAKQAKLDLPLVDELAADIFMGQFSGKFVAAAKRAGELLTGTLYATYYDIDYGAVQKLHEERPARTLSWLDWRTGQTDDSWAALCKARAGVTSAGWDVAVNGMIIEQQQILTTQNLAVLLSGLELLPELRGHFADLARNCFTWICQRQQMNPPKWHALLIMLKNTAYAWRQMVFYLSLLEKNDVDQFLVWAGEHLAQQSEEFQTRFQPAVEGLRRAAAGQSPEGENSHCFLGWTKERHWLLGPKPEGKP
jgi:hypothetical protein